MIGTRSHALLRTCQRNTLAQSQRIVKRYMSSYSHSFDDDDDFPSNRTPKRRNDFEDIGSGYSSGRDSGREQRGGGDRGFDNTSSRPQGGGRKTGGGEYDFDALFADQSGSSFGGGRSGGRNNDSMGGSGGGRGDFDDSFENAEFENIKWESENLSTFVKDFYKDRELEHVKNRSPAEVKQMREDLAMLVQGENVPNPIINFEESTLEEDYLRQIKKMGIEEPSAIQKQGIPMALAGRDMIGVSKTGSGKTLAFMLPAIVHCNAQPPMKRGDGPICLVLAPTRELAVQIQKECDKFSDAGDKKIKSVCVYGGAGRSPQMDKLANGVHIVIATPGRLLDFLSCRATNLKRCTYLVLDEADRMLEMGFQQDLKRIMDQCRPDRQTLMFSATWPKEVQQISRGYTKDPIHVQIGSLEITANNKITQKLKQIESTMEKDKEFYSDVKKHLMTGNKILVFVNQKREADRLAHNLNRARVPSAAIHGDKSQRQRDEVMYQFRKGETKILIATDVCARGIDIRDIKCVINYDMPTDVESYVHRIGRTARGDDSGESIGYMGREDLDRLARDLVPLLQRSNQEIPDWLQTHRVSRVVKQKQKYTSSFRDKSRGSGGGYGGSSGGSGGGYGGSSGGFGGGRRGREDSSYYY